MSIEDLMRCLAQRYSGFAIPRVPERKRRSALDAYLPQMRTFTMRRLYASNKLEWSIRKLADEIAQTSGRSFCTDAIRKTLKRHHLYQLWGKD
jgi:hypothetical protein